MGAAPNKANPTVWVVVVVVVVIAAGLVAIGLFRGGGEQSATPEPVRGIDVTQLSETARRGAELFQTRGCDTCHSTNGTDGIGPTMLGMWGSERALTDGSVVVADAAYVRESIVDPGAKVVEGYLPGMASYAWLGDEEINTLMAYLEALGQQR